MQQKFCKIKYQASFYKNLIFRLFLNYLLPVGSSLISDFCCRISFLNSLSLISLILASLSFSLRINSFFSPSATLLPYQTSKLPIFSSQFFQDCLYSVSKLAISSQISAIISMVTMLGLPFLSLSLFSLIFSSTSLIFLFLLTCFSWAFSSSFSFYAVFPASTLHSSFSLATCDFDFYIFQLYFVSFLSELSLFYCSFLTFKRPAFSSQRFLISIYNSRILFSFQVTELSSQTYQFCFLSSKSSFLSCMVLICCFLVQSRCSWVYGSSICSQSIPYFFFLVSYLAMISSSCSANYKTCPFNRLFCSISFQRLNSFAGVYLSLDSRKTLLWGNSWGELEPTDFCLGQLTLNWPRCAAFMFLSDQFIQLSCLQIYC